VSKTLHLKFPTIVLVVLHGFGWNYLEETKRLGASFSISSNMESSMA